MKVLILHQHFNTPQKGGAIRSYYLAKALVDQGIETIVITGHSDNTYEVRNVEGIEVHYLPIPYDNNFGFYKRSLSFVQYLKKTAEISGKFKDVTICYAISVPLTIGLAALWLKKRYHIPFLFEVGDLWPDAPIQLGFVKNYFLRQSLFLLEKKIYKAAEAVVALSPMIKASVEQKAPNTKVHLVPNMADTDFYKPEKKEDALLEKFQVRNKFVVSYIGAVGFANGLDYYLECARAAQKASLNVHFLLCGEGAMLNRLKGVAKNLEINNLTFISFQDREGVKDVLNVTDAAFICYRPLPILETGSPNKYFDGLAAGKIILINFKGWIKNEIENQRCGVYLDPQHPSSFLSCVSIFLNDLQRVEEYKANARKLAEEKYSRKDLGKAFVDIIKHHSTFYRDKKS